MSVSVESFTDALGVAHANSSDISSFVPDPEARKILRMARLGGVPMGWMSIPSSGNYRSGHGSDGIRTTYSDSSPSYCREIGQR